MATTTRPGARPSLRRLLYITVVALAAAAVLADAAKSKKKKKSKGKKEKDRCPGCKTLTDKFVTEFGKTKGRSSGGGNSAWEEAKGIKYDTSEQRLFEILENVCGSNNDCNAALEMAEEPIEDWWKEREDKETADGLHQAICVDAAKLCCKDGHFGASCKACPGGAEKPCSEHGDCQGAGSRTGSGKCKCHTGYAGKTCSKCKQDHFLKGSGTQEGFMCEKCDDACKKSCKGPGAEFCDDCTEGYAKADSGTGCADVDECALKTATCDKNKYCANTPGNYTCETCDSACHPDDGCSGPAPKDCSDESCADGYAYNAEEGCQDVDECAADHKCDVGQFCYNAPGSVSCLPCASACDPAQGCSDGTPEGCSGCKEGFEPIPDTERGCRDVDECSKENACDDPGKTCRNTRGSFECNCIPPKEEVDGKCVEPDPEVVMEKILKPKVILNSEEAVEALAAAELDLKKAQDELEGASEAQEKVAESIEAAVEMKKDEL